jgi:hypothetical protein
MRPVCDASQPTPTGLVSSPWARSKGGSDGLGLKLPTPLTPPGNFQLIKLHEGPVSRDVGKSVESSWTRSSPSTESATDGGGGNRARARFPPLGGLPANEPRRVRRRMPSHRCTSRACCPSGVLLSRRQRLNQRALRPAPNCCFSPTSCSDGSWNVPVGLGPERKSMSTRPTRPAPNSM